MKVVSLVLLEAACSHIEDPDAIAIADSRDYATAGNRRARMLALGVVCIFRVPSSWGPSSGELGGGVRLNYARALRVDAETAAVRPPLLVRVRWENDEAGVRQPIERMGGTALNMCGWKRRGVSLEIKRV